MLQLTGSTVTKNHFWTKTTYSQLELLLHACMYVAPWARRCAAEQQVKAAHRYPKGQTEQLCLLSHCLSQAKSSRDNVDSSTHFRRLPTHPLLRCLFPQLRQVYRSTMIRQYPNSTITYSYLCPVNLLVHRMSQTWTPTMRQRHLWTQSRSNRSPLCHGKRWQHRFVVADSQKCSLPGITCNSNHLAVKDQPLVP